MVNRSESAEPAMETISAPSEQYLPPQRCSNNMSPPETARLYRKDLTLSRFFHPLSIMLANMRRERRRFSAMYKQQKRLILRHLWDPKAGLFHDGINTNGRPVGRYSIHTQTLAILCDLKKNWHQNMVVERLLPYLNGKRLASALPSSYWVNYVYEVMTTLGYGREVLEHIEKNWSPMIRWGGTWEMFASDKPFPAGSGFGFGNTSMTHAWAAHPIYHLARTLGGATQTGVAWKRIRFAPILKKVATDNVQAVIPTPQGKIVSSWRKTGDGSFKIELSLPKNVQAEVFLPGLARQIVNGKRTWVV